MIKWVETKQYENELGPLQLLFNQLIFSTVILFISLIFTKQKLFENETINVFYGLVKIFL
jgi:hypothetical protein